MSWQRIDENTYIDDSLVTCAEYQLFIDQMLQQGKYHQPDHWTSHQFPQGQAREPILGVRQSDAIAFCEWLTKQENEKWKYRLPAIHEAMDFPINPSTQTSIGYWLIVGNQVEELHMWLKFLDGTYHDGTIAEYKSPFGWIGPIPENPRRIDRALNKAIARDINSILDFNTAVERAYDPTSILYRVLPKLVRVFNRATILKQFRPLIQSRAHECNPVIDPDLTRVNIRAKEHALNKDFQDYTRASIVVDQALVMQRTLSIGLAPIGYQGLKNDLARSEKRTLDRFDRARANTRNLTLALERIRTGSDDLVSTLELLDGIHTYILNLAIVLQLLKDEFRSRRHSIYHILFLDIYIDVITLQERIAGRSPAFEGIRLIKERIR